LKRIILNEEQAKLLTLAGETVEICDPQGKILCRLDPPITEEEIAELKRRGKSPGPWYSGEQVRQTLKTLEEIWNREGPFDKQRLKEILEQIRAARKSG
jgi:hypothetical protein